jgi:hypothetical protein
MRKVALLAAIVLSAAFMTAPSSVVAQDAFYEANKNGFMFVRDILNPYAASAKPAETPKVAKARKKKK